MPDCSPSLLASGAVHRRPCRRPRSDPLARNDGWTYLRPLAALIARGLHLLCPLGEQRAQGRPGARCTRGLVCNCAQKTRTRAYRYRRSIPAFPAQWLYGLLRALPGERLFCHRRPQEALLLENLTPAPRRQDHTTSPYACATHVDCGLRVHRIPPHVRDDREPPLSSGETRGVMKLICPTG